MKTYNILLIDVPQDDPEIGGAEGGDEEHIINELHEIVTRGGEEYHLTDEKVKLDGETFHIYRRADG